MNKKVKAVMMAGGFGTRIQPLTNSIPKPMLPVCNLPMMEYTLRRLVEIGITDIIVLLYYKPEVIKNYFKDGSKIGANLTYVLPDKDYGTAGAVGIAREYLDTTFILVSGDLVSDFDFKKIINHHFETNSKLTITLTSVENPLQFGVVIADENGKIEKFLEKPSWGEVFSDTINTGIYVIEPDILDYIPIKTNFDFAKDLFPLLMKKGIDLMSYNAKGYWRDVGNVDSYREVHEDIFKGLIDFKIFGRKIEYPDGVLYLMGDSTIDKSIEIIDTVVIGNSVKIDKNTKLHNVVIGDNVTIGKDCKLKNSILWHDIKIGNSVILDNSVICNNNIINDLVEAKAGLILAEGCEVGKLANFRQDVTIWPHKIIEPASIVNNNVVWGNRYKNSLFQDGNVIGKINSEISCEMACKLAEAFASQLPIGSNVIVARDHSLNARMIMRAFLGGLLSDGINVVDLKAIPSSVLRYNLSHSKKLIAGIYFRQKMDDPTSVNITFYTEKALRITNNMAKSIEKSFFLQKFRRVEQDRIGKIKDNFLQYENDYDRYKVAIKKSIDHKIIKRDDLKVVIDVMHGETKDVLPYIIEYLQINNIILNAFSNYAKLANFSTMEKNSKEEISAIVKSLNLKLGFMIYPDGQKLAIVTDKGEVLSKMDGLLLVLYLLNLDLKKKGKVFLPTWAPDFYDEKYENLEIERGEYSNFKYEDLKQYDLVATVNGNFAFTEFAPYRDGIYAILKILEMVSRHNIVLSKVVEKFEKFYYCHIKIECPQEKKGKVMRQFLALAKNKKSSTIHGVKIWEDKMDWVLMIPDSISDWVHLFIQAKDCTKGEEMVKRYKQKIKEWIK